METKKADTNIRSSNLRALASNLRPMASNLIAMASNLTNTEPMPSNSNLREKANTYIKCPSNRILHNPVFQDSTCCPACSRSKRKSSACMASASSGRTDSDHTNTQFNILDEGRP